MSAHNQDVNLDFGGLFGRTLDLIKADPVNWAILGLVGSAALGCGAWGGWQNCAKKQLAGQKPEVNDVLYPFSNISLIIPGLLAGAAMIPCVFPGVILAFLWAFATPLMIRDGLEWKDATRMSKEAVMANFVPVLLLSLISGVIVNAGAIAFGIGMLITMPFAMVMQYLALDSFYSGSTPQQLDYSPGAPAPMAAGAPAAMAPAPMAPAPMAPAPSAPAPMAPAPMAPAPSAPAPMAPAPMAPAPSAPAPTAFAPEAAPAPAPAAVPEPAEEVVETAQQATAGEAVAGKTMAMSAVDFEAMLKNRNNGES